MYLFHFAAVHIQIISLSRIVNSQLLIVSKYTQQMERFEKKMYYSRWKKGESK